MSDPYYILLEGLSNVPGVPGTSARANEMVDRIIYVMKRSAIISPQLNNITVERKLDTKHGSLEDLNIRGLIAGM